MPGSKNGGTGQAASRLGARLITAAFLVTLLDGFDAMSLSLMAPRMSADLHLPPDSLGPIFASAMGGMILGASSGGVLADKVGRLPTLLVALVLFSLAALAMPFTHSSGGFIVNRLIAGMGFGAAAPISVALLNRSGLRPSEFVIALVWTGIPVGGSVAALFNYAVVPEQGWRSIFVAGGILPVLVGLLAYRAFRDPAGGAVRVPAMARPQIGALFAAGQARRTIATAVMFLFGYMLSSVVVNWLPTALSHRQASTPMISATFAAINFGSVLGIVALGFVAKRARSRWTLVGAWLAAGLSGLSAALPTLGSWPIALLAIAAVTFGAGAQALSVAFANQLHRANGLESTSIGLMTSFGRLGQFGALASSGALLRLGVPEVGLFAFAGAGAAAAGVVAWFLGGARPPDVNASLAPTCTRDG